MRILTVVGARPQFIKSGPVSRALRETGGAVTEFVVHTGQHYDYGMSQTFFDELELRAPDVNLGIGSAGHGAQTGRMLEALEAVLLAQQPDAVLVYGDTNSTLAGALAAAKLLIPVGHVEAGLRSYNRRMPEEINRVLADRLSAWCFCPTQTAVDNLAGEGITAGVHVVGDVMYDALQHYREAADDAAALAEVGVQPRGYDLLTIHRAENTADAAPLRALLDALGKGDRPTLFPVHPRTRNLLGEAARDTGTLRLLEPVSYRTMLALEANARLILTDSGGVQKEAYWLRVPCVTLRAETEWVETLDGGWNRLSAFEPAAVLSAIAAVEATEPDASHHRTVYGDGHAAEGIVRVLRA